MRAATTPELGGEEAVMTDHQMDVLLKMVLLMHNTLDADAFNDKIIGMIKDQADQDKLLKEYKNN